MSLVGTKPWLSNYIHCFLWDVITHSCYNMSSVRHQAITHTDADFLKIKSLDKLHWNLNPDKNTVFQRNTHENVMSMAQRKTAVTPLLTHWSYCSLALSHQCVKWKSFCSGLMVLTPETWWRHVASKILVNTVSDKQRVLMHAHQGWNVRHGLCHIYMIYVYIWVVYSFCLCCCLFIIVTTQFVALYKPCKPKPKPSTYDAPPPPPDNHPLAEIQIPILRPEPKQQICQYAINMQIQTISVSK